MDEWMDRQLVNKRKRQLNRFKFLVNEKVDFLSTE